MKEDRLGMITLKCLNNSFLRKKVAKSQSCLSSDVETKRSQDEGKADFPSEGEAVTLSRPSPAFSLGTVPDKAALPQPGCLIYSGH